MSIIYTRKPKSKATTITRAMALKIEKAHKKLNTIFVSNPSIKYHDYAGLVSKTERLDYATFLSKQRMLPYKWRGTRKEN